MERFWETERGMEISECGAYVLYADAQATIAALQARVQELEAEGVKLFEWRLALHSLTPGGSEFCTPNACEEWVRKHRASQHEYLIEQIKQRKDLQSQLTQRTAELEAAKQQHGQSENAAQLYYRELTRAKNRICEAAGLPPDSGYEPAIKHLQAELERVRGERDQWREAFERSCDDTAHLKAALTATSQEGQHG